MQRPVGQCGPHQDCDWGIYSDEHNRAIEAAYQNALPQVEITVGVRAMAGERRFLSGQGQYQVVFGPPGFARQEVGGS